MGCVCGIIGNFGIESVGTFVDVLPGSSAHSAAAFAIFTNATNTISESKIGVKIGVHSLWISANVGPRRG